MAPKLRSLRAGHVDDHNDHDGHGRGEGDNDDEDILHIVFWPRAGWTFAHLIGGILLFVYVCCHLYSAPSMYEGTVIVNNEVVPAKLSGYGVTLTTTLSSSRKVVYTPLGTQRYGLDRQYCTTGGAQWEIDAVVVFAEVTDPAQLIEAGGAAAMMKYPGVEAWRTSGFIRLLMHDGVQDYFEAKCSNISNEAPMRANLHEWSIEAKDHLVNMYASRPDAPAYGIEVKNVIIPRKFSGEQHDIDDNYNEEASAKSRAAAAKAQSKADEAVADRKWKNLQTLAAQEQSDAEAKAKRAVTAAEAAATVARIEATQALETKQKEREAERGHMSMMLEKLGPVRFDAWLKYNAVGKTGKGVWVADSCPGTPIVPPLPIAKVDV